MDYNNNNNYNKIKFSKESNHHLKTALKQLHQTHKLGENSIENLLEQSEILENTKKNMNIIDDRMDVADNIIQKMNSLFKIPVKRKKHILKFEQDEQDGENESMLKNVVEGYVLKRTRHLGIWVKRYFKFNLDSKIIEYFLTIADTFHDFGKESENFEESWSKNTNFKN